MSPRTLALLLVAAHAVTIPSAHADERTARIDPSAVAGVTLILTPPGLQTRAPVTQATLPNYGCTFTASLQPDKHAAMLDILKRKLVDIPADEAGHFRLRNAVYLRMADGSTIRYLFGEAMGAKREIHGGSETGVTAGYIPFRSDDVLLRELRHWAASGTAQIKPSSQCLDKQRFLAPDDAQP
ncbi:MAG: hypothetical protein AB1437_21150 [Pseudomonadota bacterium]